MLSTFRFVTLLLPYALFRSKYPWFVAVSYPLLHLISFASSLVRYLYLRELMAFCICAVLKESIQIMLHFI